MPNLYCNVSDPDYIYFYCPSLSAAIAFSALFGVSTLIHIFQAFLYKKKFCWVIVMAGAWETLGFIFRVLSVYDISPEGFGSPSQILILLAPLWVNAFVYMILARAVYYFMPDKKLAKITARWLGVIFICLDIVAFFVQGAGAVMASAGKENVRLLKIGLDVFQGGIGVQEFFIVIFIALVIQFQRKMAIAEKEYPRPTNWRKVIFPLYTALALITVRVIYRLVEYSKGFDDGLVTQEKYLYILEAAPLTICLMMFNVFHPGAVLVGEESEFPKKPKKEKKPKKDKKEKKDKEDKTMLLEMA